MRPGLRQESSTVNRAEQAAAPTKISGIHGGDADHAVQPGHDHRRQLCPHQPAQHQPQGDARQSSGVSAWLADDAPQLPGRGADGFQQAVKPDVIGDGDLEHIVDNEVAGEDDEQQHRGDGEIAVGVQAVGQLGAGIAPVDAGVDIVVPRRFSL